MIQNPSISPNPQKPIMSSDLDYAVTLVNVQRVRDPRALFTTNISTVFPSENNGRLLGVARNPDIFKTQNLFILKKLIIKPERLCLLEYCILSSKPLVHIQWIMLICSPT